METLKMIFLSMFAMSGIGVAAQNFGDTGETMKFSVDGIHYSVIANKENCVEVYSDNENYYEGNVVIPSTVEYEGVTYTVTALAKQAFIGNNCAYRITSVTFPETLTEIGDWAMGFCEQIKSLDFPESLEIIGNSAFANCSSLESVTLPAGVKKIGNSAFQDCSSLATVDIKNCNIERLDDCVFQRCYALTSLEIPTTVKTIGEWVCYYCKSLEKVVIPAEVTEISQFAFYNCTMLKNVEILAQEPLALGGVYVFGDEFSDFTLQEGTLTVPFGCREKYMSATGWKKFKNIVEASSGVQTVDSNSFKCKPVEGGLMITTTVPMNVTIYDVDGKCLFVGTINGAKFVAVESYFCIVKLGDSIQKVILK